jgi:hypothetical protein
MQSFPLQPDRIRIHTVNTAIVFRLAFIGRNAFRVRERPAADGKAAPAKSGRHAPAKGPPPRIPRPASCP